MAGGWLDELELKQALQFSFALGLCKMPLIVGTEFRVAHRRCTDPYTLSTPSEPDAVECDPCAKSCLYFTLYSGGYF